MSVKTYKDAEEKKASSANNKKEKAKEAKKTVKLYLPQITHNGLYNCIIEYNGKQEKIKITDGIIEVDNKKDLEKYLSLGFKKVVEKIEDFGIYFCDEYINNSFNLELDDNSKIKVDNGKAEPFSQYQVDQLIKRHFKLYKYNKNI